jgi:hypothetical protein
VSRGLDRVEQVAKQGKKEKFTALLHRVMTAGFLDAALAPKRRGGPQVDGVTWQDDEADRQGNLQDLPARVQSGA